MAEFIERVTRVDYQGRAAWRKHYTPQGRRKRMAVLRWLARLLGANALLAPTPLSPIEACATERNMIQRLQLRNVLVPEVLETGKDYVVLSDLGTIFSIACLEAGTTSARLNLLRKGFVALNDLHRRGAYLSQAFARNITIKDGRIGFIDLEEDPGKVMPLAAAQARDILFFVHSTARFMTDAPYLYQSVLKQCLDEVPRAIRVEIAKVARILRYLLPIARLLPGRARMAALAWQQLIKVSLHV